MTQKRRDELEALYREVLDYLVCNNIIMIDTCSLMETGCESMIEKLEPFLKKYHKKLVVPLRVIEELRKHSMGELSKRTAARKGLEICQWLNRENCLTVRGGECDHFADNTFYVQFARLRGRYQLALITQDRDLSYDILQLNHLKSAGGNPVRVYKILKNGYLVPMEE